MGALTLKPLAYKTRPWELNNIEIINFLDSYCGQIAIQKRGNEILRILPSRKDNYYWINDKIRFFFESLKKQRVTYPLIFLNKKYIKINWQLSVLLLKYINIFSNIINNISSILESLEVKKFKSFKDLVINYNEGSGDLLSNYLLKEFLNNRNLIKYEFIEYKGNINNNFYKEKFLQEIKKSKYNILNNINIINDYPRIWTLIKKTKIMIIGNKNYFKFANYIIDNTNKEESKIKKSKSILGFFQNDTIFYTEKEIKNNNNTQILLNKNSELLNKKWINNKIDKFKKRKDSLNWYFFNKNQNNCFGINFNFLTHGVEEIKGYHIIFPITTFIEEYSIRMNPYGYIQKSIPVNIRGTNMRTLAQILFLFKTIFNNEEKITKNKIDFKLLKEILILKYGIIMQEAIEKEEFLIKPKNKENSIIMIKATQENDLFKHSDVLKIKSKFLNKKNNY